MLAHVVRSEVERERSLHARGTVAGVGLDAAYDPIRSSGSVNTARGGLVDEAALVRALDGRRGGALPAPQAGIFPEALPHWPVRRFATHCVDIR
jgi:hypothetical protein